MLALQICGVAVSYLSTLPSTDWLALTSQAYRCPVRVVQASKVSGLEGFLRQQGTGDERWRILPVSRIEEVQPGDGVLLPDPAQLFWRPALRGQLRDAAARGVPLVLHVPDTQALPAAATAFAGWKVPVSAALLDELPANLSSLPAGTYLARKIGGLALMPRTIQQGGVTIVPFLPELDTGERATFTGESSTLALRPSLSWVYAAQRYVSSQPPQGRAAWVAALLAGGWSAGTLLSTPLPSLISLASETVAWAVLLMLVLTLLALVGTFVRRASAPGVRP